MEPESPPSRTTILSTFLRGRPRNTSTSQPPPLHIITPGPPPADSVLRTQEQPRDLSPLPPASPRQHSAFPPSPNPTQQGLGFTNMLRRRRSGQDPLHALQGHNTAAALAMGTYSSTQTHRIRIVPHITRGSLRFEPITRDLSPPSPLRIGRFTDRSGLASSTLFASGNKIAFKSKVVSRTHAEILVDPQGKFWIKDTKSSSGTFVNHVRLSLAGQESKLVALKDGDLVQFGVDYQGGAEDVYKSVKVRIEIGREWQSGVNAFNTNAIKQLKTIAGDLQQQLDKGGKKKKSKSNIPDCCICLFGVTIQQALFVAPCSHTFHFKCIRPLIEQFHPSFNCPLCRTYADLNADVEVDPVEDETDEEEEERKGETDVEDLGIGRGRTRVSPDLEEVEGVLSEEREEEEGEERSASAEVREVVMEEQEEQEDVIMLHEPAVAVVVGELGEGGVLVDGDATVGEKRKR